MIWFYLFQLEQWNANYSWFCNNSWFGYDHALDNLEILHFRLAEKEKLLKEKLGIEGGGEASTKDVLKSVINKKLTEKYLGGSSGSEQQKNAASQNEADNSPQNQEDEKPKDLKEQLKEEVKNRLLDSLFGG